PRWLESFGRGALHPPTPTPAKRPEGGPLCAHRRSASWPLQGSKETGEWLVCRSCKHASSQEQLQGGPRLPWYSRDPEGKCDYFRCRISGVLLLRSQRVPRDS